MVQSIRGGAQEAKTCEIKVLRHLRSSDSQIKTNISCELSPRSTQKQKERSRTDDREQTSTREEGKWRGFYWAVKRTCTFKATGGAKSASR